MKKLWKIQKHSRLDKYYKIIGPNDFYLIVDNDDIAYGHYTNVKKVVKILNENWNKEILKEK